MRELNTSKLGPIKHEPDQDAARAKLVREAFNCIAQDSQGLGYHWERLASEENSAVLAKLGRLLK